MPLVGEYGNVFVLKTLSKAYALAGARLGFVVCAPEVADALLAVRQPYSVSRFDQVAAETVVEMRASLKPARDALVENRALLGERLAALADEVGERLGSGSVCVYPSEANFVLVRLSPDVPGLPSADEVHERLACEHSVLVRNFFHTPGLEGCLRLTVGTPEENDRSSRRCGTCSDWFLSSKVRGPRWSAMRPDAVRHARPTSPSSCASTGGARPR